MRFAGLRLWAIEHFGTWPNRLHALAIVLVGIVAVGDISSGRSGWWRVASIEVALVAALYLRVRSASRRRVLGGWDGLVEIHADFDGLPSSVAAGFGGEQS